MHLSKWRGIPINSPRSYSIVNGNFDLFISSDDVSSIGSVSGILSCPLAAAEGNGYYIGDFQILHAITDSDIECDAKGSFEVTSRPAGMYRITESGTAPAELRSVGAGSEPWTFRWTLSPSESERNHATKGSNQRFRRHGRRP